MLYYGFLLVCDSVCGLPGCVLHSTSQCCHPKCLGGCSKPNDPSKCSACAKYRVWKTGLCVDECPKDTYLVRIKTFLVHVLIFFCYYYWLFNVDIRKVTIFQS